MPTLRADLKRSLNTRLARLRAGGFAPAVGLLVSGTAIGHAITAVAMPVLTRLYTPDDFGLFAVFSAALAIVAVAACLRYEIAIPIPQAEDTAANLLAVAVCAAVLVSAASALAVLPAGAIVAGWLGQPRLESYLWLLPLAILLSGVYAAQQYWLLRHKQFALLARTRISQSAAASGSQLALGAAGASAFGLLTGPVVNLAAGCLRVAPHLFRQRQRLLPAIGAARMWQAARSHANFPLFSTAEALANSAAIQLPVMLIAALASSAEAGQLMLAMYVVQAPMALLGTAVGQVYLTRAAEAWRVGQLGALTTSVVAGLLRTGVGPLLFLGLAAPFLFGPLFGADWRRAGTIVAWLTPWFVMQFLASPVSMALHVAARQRLAMLLQLAGLALRCGAVLLAHQLFGAYLTEAYALSGLLFYLAGLLATAAVANCEAAQFRAAIAGAALPIGIWAGAGVIVAALARWWQ